MAFESVFCSLENEDKHDFEIDLISAKRARFVDICIYRSI